MPGKIHPNPPLVKEGIPPFIKGRLGGILLHWETMSSEHLRIEALTGEIVLI